MSEHKKQLPIGYWLRRADELLTRRIDEAQRANGLTRLAWQALNVIRERRTAGRDEIAGTLESFAEASTLDGVLDALVAEGLVGGSARSGFELTSAGAELYDNALVAQQAIRRQAMAGIHETDYATALRVIQKMASNLERGDAP